MSKRMYQAENALHIVSEPGDMTRYDYYLIPDGPDAFTIAPGKSTFMFPQRMSIWEAQIIIENNEALLKEYSTKYSCNPCTVLEVANACIEVHR